MVYEWNSQLMKGRRNGESRIERWRHLRYL